MGVIVMKKEYIKTCLEDLNKQEKSIKDSRKYDRFFVAFGLLVCALGIAFPINQAFFQVMAIYLGLMSYIGLHVSRINKPKLNRIDNERNHLQELSLNNPSNSKELHGRRMTKLRELAQAKNTKEKDRKTSHRFYTTLLIATELGIAASYYFPFMIPLTIASGISTLIAGEQNVKFNRQVEELTNRKNNLDNDISVLQEYEKDVKNAQRQREAQISRQKQVPQRQTTYRGTPKAAAKTANESMVDQYLEQISHPVVRETVKQKIK